MGIDEVPSFSMTISSEGCTRVVHVIGELDLATRDAVNRACFAGNEFAVLIDMSELRFMDCSGYGGVVSTRIGLEAHGASLTLCGAVGQPARLLELIAKSDHRPTNQAA